MDRDRTFGRRGFAPAAYGAPRPVAPPPIPKMTVPVMPAAAVADTPQYQARIAIPWLSLILALLLAFAYFMQWSTGYEPDVENSASILDLQGGLSRPHVQEGQWWRLLTAPLMHASSTHLFANLLSLLLVGVLLERRIGRAWFMVIFCAGALTGGLVSLMFLPVKTVAVGASDAVIALGMAGLCLQMRAYSIHRQGAWMIALFSQVAILPLLPGDPTVDLAGHIGGAIAGVAMYALLTTLWSPDSDMPAARVPARIIAGFGWLAAVIGVFTLILCFPGNLQAWGAQSPTPNLIPRSVLPESYEARKRMGRSLVEAFPDDPLAHYLCFLTLAGRRTGDHEAEARQEAELTLVTVKTTGERYARMENQFRISMASELARKYKDLPAARAMAAPACGDRTLSPGLRKLILVGKLCPLQGEAG